MPLFVQFMEVVAPSLPWIARKLSCPLELVFKRFHMYLERMFSTAEDSMLEEALPCSCRLLLNCGRMHGRDWGT